MSKIIKKRLSKIKNCWDIENAFYQKCHTTRIAKILNHYEMYKLSKRIGGDIIELGVFKGNSLIRFSQFRNYFNQQSKKTVFAFDIFGRFPNSYRKVRNNILKFEKNFAKIHDKNSGTGLNLKSIKKIFSNKKIFNIKFIKGDVLKTVDKFLSIKRKLKISLIHLDLDVYLPTKICLEKFYRFISKGGVVIIDDYNVHPGATVAVKEFIAKKKIKLQKPFFGTGPYFFVKK